MIEAVPLLCPQVDGVFVIVAAKIEFGCKIIVEEGTLQLRASVTVTVYVPALRLEAVAAAPPLGLHENKYGAVPPVGVTVAVPLFPLKQLTGVLIIDEVIAAG